MRSHRVLSLVSLVLLCAGCGNGGGTTYAPSPAPSSGYGDYGYGGEIQFLDSAPANVTDVVGLTELTFTNPSGEATRVRDLAGPNGAVVVVTRGNTNPICPYCSTQTSHYIRDYDQFRERGVEVILVYPIESRSDESRLTAFLEDARGRLDDKQRPVPFPVLFDVELTAVDQLGIRQDLSKPATYIVDSSGDVRYAYVGAHLADRPTVAAVVRTLDELGIGPTAAPGDANGAQESSSSSSSVTPESRDASPPTE